MEEIVRMWRFTRGDGITEGFHRKMKCSRSHNLILIGQPPLMDALRLSINEEVRSCVTYSVTLQPLALEIIQVLILDQLDRVGLAHNTFSDDALALIRSGEGLLKRTRNLCLSALIETVREQGRTVTLQHVNRVLMQPHWREHHDSPCAS